MENLPTVVILYCMAAVVALAVMRWVEQGQPDPLDALDRLPVASLRKETA
jgi:hypothetical protein